MPHPQRPAEDEGTLRTDEQADPATRYQKAEHEFDPNNPPTTAPEKPADTSKRFRASKVLRTDEGENPSQAVRDSYTDS